MGTSVEGWLAASLAERHDAHQRRTPLHATANAPLPAILLDSPALLLHLQPASRRPRLVQARLVLGDQALIVVRDHLGSRLEAVLREPSHRKDQVVVGDDVFKPIATLTQRTPG
jgi:hypothetical protein